MKLTGNLDKDYRAMQIQFLKKAALVIGCILGLGYLCILALSWFASNIR